MTDIIPTCPTEEVIIKLFVDIGIGCILSTPSATALLLLAILLLAASLLGLVSLGVLASSLLTLMVLVSLISIQITLICRRILGRTSAAAAAMPTARCRALL